MKFDHLDLSALGVTYVLFHHTPHFLTHHLKPCFSFLVFSILTTLIISFAKQLFIIFQVIKSSQAHFLEKSLVVIAVCPRQSAFRESETHFSSFSPPALLLLCRPLAINCLHSSLLAPLPSYLFSCKMLGLIGEKW